MVRSNIDNREPFSATCTGLGRLTIGAGAIVTAVLPRVVEQAWPQTRRVVRQVAEVPEESEPDYRFTLANERTFLAWLRTALSLLAAGVALEQFAPQLAAPGVRTAIAAALGLLSVLAAGGGLLRWRRVQRLMRRGQPLPVAGSGVVLALGLAVVGLVVSVLLVVRG